MNPNSSSLPRQVVYLIGFILITFCAALAGAFFMPGPWYQALEKPEWNPPAWIFGPVWTTLYGMMAFAAWLVWKRDGWKLALSVYIIQLILNAAWSPIFFGAHELGWALVEILFLWAAILATLLSFHRISKPAAWLMAPYLAWVSFASFLNFTLWRMNPG